MSKKDAKSLSKGMTDDFTYTEKGQTSNKADLIQTRMIFKALHVQQPVVGIHVDDVRLVAALLNGNGGRHEREVGNDGEWLVRARTPRSRPGTSP